MPNHCINLSAAEVRACLTGHAVLWRPVSQQPGNFPCFWNGLHYPSEKHWVKSALFHCPFGEPGDVLIGREAWCPSPDGPIYKATQHESGITGPDDYDVFRSPATMPASIARIRMTVKAVDVRRVQNITEEEAKQQRVQEGCGNTVDGCAMDYCRAQVCGCPALNYRGGFMEQWDKRFPATPWADNPWAWRVEVQHADTI